MTWIGIDDTDSPRGGCTTWALTELIRTATNLGADLIGYPRLVRLDPNIPGKTRGNAALSAQFGRGRGARRTIGAISGAPVRSYARGEPLPPRSADRLVEEGWKAVLAASRQGEPGTDPALVAVPHRLPSSLYWEAVCSQIALEPVRDLLRSCNAEVRSSGGEVGVIGAAAAVSWPGSHPTWELLAYRDPSRVGTPRRIHAEALRGALRAYPELFLCRDPGTRRILVAPHTSCPILFGLRATKPARLPRAARDLADEPVERWAVFRTNQGTGDHLAHTTFGELRPYDAGRVTATVAEPPRGGAGGHWHVRLRDGSGAEMTCFAFEPTKWLPSVLRRLVVGDHLRIWGGVGAAPPFRLEGVEIVKLAHPAGSRANPLCENCGRRTKSQGRMRGFRCTECALRLPPEARPMARTGRWIRKGAYHPTPSARRHLALRAPEGSPGPSEIPQYRRRPRGHLYR